MAGLKPISSSWSASSSTSDRMPASRGAWRGAGRARLGEGREHDSTLLSQTP